MLTSVGTLSIQAPTSSSSRRFHMQWTKQVWSKLRPSPARNTQASGQGGKTNRVYPFSWRIPRPCCHSRRQRFDVLYTARKS